MPNSNAIPEPIRAEPLTDLSRIAIHTATTKPLSLQQCCAEYAQRGFGGICVWDDAIGDEGPDHAARFIKDAGLRVPAIVRGGFFVSDDPEARQSSLDMNRQRIAQAAAIGADMVVLVAGAQPGIPLETARAQTADGIAAILPDAEKAGVKLAIEPLHPMYAGDRCCINRIAEARTICDQLASPMLGVAVDVYHVWWDPDLESEIEALGRANQLFGFHVCDWKTDTDHLLLDRGLMGDGVIDIRAIRAMVERAGFDGTIEVEIFSRKFWAMDQGEYLDLIKARCLDCV